MPCKCKVQSAICGMWSVKCRVWSVKCRLWNVEGGGVQSVEREESAVLRGKCPV